jgi:hypothetical protein
MTSTRKSETYADYDQICGPTCVSCGVIDASYRYAPPEDSSNAAALRWASAEKWDPPRPFDIPAARKLLLPRLIWESPREESPSG